MLSHYCGGHKAVNVIQFYCWLNLLGVSFGLLSTDLGTNGVTGQASSTLDDDDSPLSKGKRKRKSKEGASVLAAQTLAAAINKPMPPSSSRQQCKRKKLSWRRSRPRH